MFRFQRPQYEEFPQDAIASFANIYRIQLLNPRAVITEAEDWWRSDEASRIPRPGDDFDNTESLPKRVVVGIRAGYCHATNLPTGVC